MYHSHFLRVLSPIQDKPLSLRRVVENVLSNCAHHALFGKDLILFWVPQLILLKREKRIVKQVLKCVVEELSHWHLAVELLRLHILHKALKNRVRFASLKDACILCTLGLLARFDLRIVSDLFREHIPLSLLVRVAIRALGSDLHTLELGAVFKHCRESTHACIIPVLLVVRGLFNRDLFKR